MTTFKYPYSEPKFFIANQNYGGIAANIFDTHIPHLDMALEKSS